MSTLGKGITFPIELQNGGPVIATGESLIESSIQMILGTTFGERYFMGQFGSKLEELLEEPNDSILWELIEFFIFDALNLWEPRITITDTKITSKSSEKVEVLIMYRINQNNVEKSYIYPFYKTRNV